MPETPIDALVAGSRTAKPVVTPSGMTLVGEGTVLTASLIARLKSVGVARVFIAGEAGAASGPSLEERLAAIDARFAPHAGNALMMDLRDVLVRQTRDTYAGAR
jgi:hypothetical protein